MSALTRRRPRKLVHLGYMTCIPLPKDDGFRRYLRDMKEDKHRKRSEKIVKGRNA